MRSTLKNDAQILCKHIEVERPDLSADQTDKLHILYQIVYILLAILDIQTRVSSSGSVNYLMTRG